MKNREKHPHIHHGDIASTHRFALDNGNSLEDGTVVTADHQSEGRGRRGREWASPSGESLLLSIVLKPKIRAGDATLITPILSIAVAELLKDYRLSPMIRWPNDLLIGEGKIAGILAEASISGDEMNFVVASLGLNVLQSKEVLDRIDRPATSIKAELGIELKPSDLLPQLLKSFDALWNEFISTGFKNLLKGWQNLLMPTGSLVTLDLGGNIIQGRVSGFGGDGSMEILDDSGNKRSFHSGEIVRLKREGG